MHHFTYRDGRLLAEDVALEDLAVRFGTPTYVYASATLERHYQVMAQALDGLDHRICFALKANSNQAVIATLAKLGAGADVVSLGEFTRAQAAGISPSRIVFSGVGKSDEEMAAALQADIFQINVESVEELARLEAVARRLNRRAAIALRVNPEVDARTHAKITTGKGENKFGIALDQVPAAAEIARGLTHIDLKGLAVHIGSQLTDLDPLEAAFTKLVDLYRALQAQGHRLTRLDLGGGLGIPYRGEAPPLPAAYGAMVKRVVGPTGASLVVEPGRMIVGNAGVLLTRVLYVKKGQARDFLILDAAMNDLIRPAMYDAWHDILPVQQNIGAPLSRYDVVGPVCETGDTFARDRDLPPMAAGDLVAMMSAGAYGAVMSSTYNTRPLLAEVLVKGGEAALVRPRETIAEVIARDRMAPWLAP